MKSLAILTYAASQGVVFYVQRRANRGLITGDRVHLAMKCHISMYCFGAFTVSESTPSTLRNCSVNNILFSAFQGQNRITNTVAVTCMTKIVTTRKV